MKIAIHHREGSFSSYWVKYCEDNQIDYKIVDCYSNDIIDQVCNCDALMWHHSHVNYKDALFSKTLLFTLEQAGMAVFPDFKTGWHFDDKVGQKYLLESIDAPMVPSFVFYDKESAVKWAAQVEFPKVFKLRGGAGATNVRLVKDQNQCNELIYKAFSNGFPQYSSRSGLKDTFKKYQAGTGTLKSVFGAINRVINPREFDRMASREKGYVYFQEFIPGNSYDIRLIVIDGKYAYGMKRMNRKDDFRASGSSKFVYEDIPLEAVSSAFDVAKKLELQSAAFDFVIDINQKPLIIEVSYGFGTTGSQHCPGFWTSDLEWHECLFNPHAWMVESVIAAVKNS